MRWSGAPSPVPRGAVVDRGPLVRFVTFRSRLPGCGLGIADTGTGGSAALITLACPGEWPVVSRTVRPATAASATQAAAVKYPLGPMSDLLPQKAKSRSYHPAHYVRLP